MDDADAQPIWVVMASHDRCETTLACLRSLAAQTGVDWSLAHCVVVDDGSADATAEAVRRQFPMVTLSHQSGGDLYWARAMAIGAEIAIERGAHTLWMVNDDVEFDPDALQRMLNVRDAWSSTTGHTPWVVGSTRSPVDDTTTYGGWSRRGRIIVRVHLLPAPATPTPCATTSFNSILVPVERYRSLGGFDPRFPHLRADHDLGYRATASGDDLVVVPGHVGTCAANPPSIWQRPSEPLLDRLRDVQSMKWYPPGPSLRYTTRHYGIVGLASFVRPYVLVVMSHVRDRLVSRRRTRDRRDGRRSPGRTGHREPPVRR